MPCTVDHFKLLVRRPLYDLSGDHDLFCTRLASRTLRPGLGQTPYWQMLNTISAFRILRVALHNEKSRIYLQSVSQITPVLMHFGSLVMCFLYFAAVVAMELLAKEPELRKIQSASWTRKQNDALVYFNPCKSALPNFDCPSSALITMFMMFTGGVSVKAICWSCIALCRDPD